MNYKKTPSFLKILISLSFIILILYYLFGKNPESIKRDLLLVNYNYIVLSMIFGAWAYVSRSIRWIVLLRALGYTPSKYNSFAAVSIGYLTNLLIPRAGEISRCAALNNVEKIPVSKLLGTIIIERIIDFIFLIILLILTIIIKFDVILELYKKIDGGKESNTPLFLIIILGLSVCLFFIKVYLKESALYKKIMIFLQGLKEGVNSIKNIKYKKIFWTHTILIWLMYFLMIYICFFSMDDTSNLTLNDGLFLLVLGGIGMLFPTPGGIGSYHYIVMISLVVLQVPNGYININFLEYDNYNSALLFPTVVWFAQSFVAVILGIISLFILFLSNKDRLC